METWKEIPGFDGMYEVSDSGRVRSFRNGRWGRKDEALILNPILKKGFHMVNLRRPDEKSANCYLIHRLVAEAFVPNPNGYRYVKHKDGDTINNRADNLFWSTFKMTNERSDTVTTFEGYKPKTAKPLIAKAQAKQLVGVHNCPYASSLQCESPDSQCKSCGWNPVVDSKRRRMLDRGQLSKNIFGLLRLKLKP